MLEGDLSKLKQGLARVPQTTFRAVEKAFQQSGQQFQRTMTLERFRPFESNYNRGDILQSRTGFLKKSIGYSVTGETLGTLELRVFSAGMKYANIQEYGGVVRPKNAKYLALPIGNALGPRGVARKSGPRAYPDGFFFTSKKGNLIFAVKTGSKKKRRIEPLYLLRKSVTIPPRFGFRKTWTKLGPDRIQRVRAGFQTGLRQAFGGSI